MSSTRIISQTPHEALGYSSIPTDLDHGFHHTPWSGSPKQPALAILPGHTSGQNNLELALDSTDRTLIVFPGGSLDKGLILRPEVTTFWPLCLIYHNPHTQTIVKGTYIASL